MPTILIFLKAPRAGYVKTRLADSVGAERALQVYKALVLRQLSAIPRTSDIEIHYAPQDAAAEMQIWLGGGLQQAQFYPQNEGGLGSRLRHAAESAFERGAQSVICIGGDCPLLNEQHFRETEYLLENEHDLVFGPSEDGGYYLIALKSRQPELFRNIPWSSPDTLQASLNKASELDLKVGLLEILYDVDEEAELERALADGLINP